MEADREPPVEGAGREVAGWEDKGWAEEVRVGSHRKEAVGLRIRCVSECVCEEKINKTKKNELINMHRSSVFHYTAIDRKRSP